MLLAETHGHIVPEALDSEDYLTSAVFGHLRYIPPNIFWTELLANAMAMPSQPSASNPKTLIETLKIRNIDLAKFNRLEVLFWPSHRLFGVPDLILCFTAPDKLPLIILIEAKLWSDKSGTGDQDQIARYLRLLEQPEAVQPPLPRNSLSLVVYLTPRESLTELEESLSVCQNPTEARQRLFRLQWQDLSIAARHALPTATENATLILRDVISFLSSRDLEYFSGFKTLLLPTADWKNMKLFDPLLLHRSQLFPGFQVQIAPWRRETSVFCSGSLPAEFTIQRGKWA